MQFFTIYSWADKTYYIMVLRTIGFKKFWLGFLNHFYIWHQYEFKRPHMWGFCEEQLYVIIVHPIVILSPVWDIFICPRVHLILLIFIISIGFPNRVSQLPLEIALFWCLFFFKCHNIWGDNIWGDNIWCYNIWCHNIWNYKRNPFTILTGISFTI